jgi:hypothetical protein
MTKYWLCAYCGASLTLLHSSCHTCGSRVDAPTRFLMLASTSHLAAYAVAKYLGSQAIAYKKQVEQAAVGTSTVNTSTIRLVRDNLYRAELASCGHSAWVRGEPLILIRKTVRCPYCPQEDNLRKVAAIELSKVETSSGAPIIEGNEGLDDLSVHIYLDTKDDEKIRQIIADTDRLVDLLGFDGPLEARIERGSIIRRSKATIKDGLTSSEVKARLANLEQALVLYGIDDKQAQVDAKFANVISALIEALKDVPNACIRAGSTFIIKYDNNGCPVLQNRKLTEIEIRALERYPEIQNDPRNAIAAIAMAIEKLEGSDVKFA